jgi:hypothetical protein
MMTDLGLLDDEEFWTWLCVRHGWKTDIWGWIREHCPQQLGEDYNAYIYRAMKQFNASEPLDRELYYNLIQFLSIACDPNILEFPHIAQYATKACQQAEKDLYALGWSFEEIAEVCQRKITQMQSSGYQSWAMSKLSQIP